VGEERHEVSDFFVLKLPELDSTQPQTRYQAVDARLVPAEKCAACGEAGPQEWQSPHRVKLVASGVLLSDVAFGPRTDLLVTREFQQFWQAYGFTGLSGFSPVTVVDVSANTTFTGDERAYLHCSIARTDGWIDDKESEVERTGGRLCAQCGTGGVLKHLRRVKLKNLPATMPDLFLVKGLPIAVLATPRFAEALGKSGITGCELVAAEQIRAL
jgi:hypothetical protein